MNEKSTKTTITIYETDVDGRWVSAQLSIGDIIYSYYTQNAYLALSVFPRNPGLINVFCFAAKKTLAVSVREFFKPPLVATSDNSFELYKKVSF